MKKWLVIFAVLLMASGAQAATTTIGALTGDTTPGSTDVVEIEQSDASASNKATLGNVITKAHGLGNWKWFYTDGSGVINAVGNGAAGTIPLFQGTTAAPIVSTFTIAAPGAAGGMLLSDGANNWARATTLTGLTFDLGSAPAAGAGAAVAVDADGILTTTITALLPDAADGATLGSTAAEWSDLFLADGGVINLGNDQDVTLTHVADAGITINSTMKFHFGDTGTYVNQSADGTLNIVADTIAQIMAPNIKLGIDAAAYLNVATADGGGTTISQVSDGTDLINIGDGVDDEVRLRMPQTTANGTWSGITLEFADCAASLAFGTPVYVQSTGKPAAAKADAIATMPAIGIIVVASTNADDPCTVLTHGRASATAWPTLTSGGIVYVDDTTAGVVTQTVGDITGTDSVVQVLGIGLSGDTMLVNPSFSLTTKE